jgi:hypothetical protein
MLVVSVLSFIVDPDLKRTHLSRYMANPNLKPRAQEPIRKPITISFEPILLAAHLLAQQNYGDNSVPGSKTATAHAPRARRLVVHIPER